ncbi:MAG: MerR family transcriptional regulator [Candidatus Limnocylindrales bacterium]
MSESALSTPSAAGHEALWLSLGPASRLLGIDPDTLRRWADQGRVEAWTTPGGHRRFDRRELERLSVARRATGADRHLASLGASPERLNRVYRRLYANGAPGATVDRGLDDTEREAYRQDGRRLIAALTAYLDALADDATARDRAEADARAIVDDQAHRLAGTGAGLTEAVSRFVAARQPFLAEIAGIGRRRSLDAARLAVLYGDASALLDRLLLRFIETHQQSSG